MSDLSPQALRERAVQQIALAGERVDVPCDDLICSEDCRKCGSVALDLWCDACKKMLVE